MASGLRQSVFPDSAVLSLRQSSLGSTNVQSQQSSALQARIVAKRQELENLKQLRDLSRALANQIGALEKKLSTLRDGTEAVACVLANWNNVLRAISMASRKVPQPMNGEGDAGASAELPVTLVRIPAHTKEQHEIDGT